MIAIAEREPRMRGPEATVPGSLDRPSRARRGGFSTVEFLVIAVVFGIGVTTLYTMFWTTSEEAFKSKWSYLAAHAAREELEAIRGLNLFGRRGSTAYAGHDWRQLAGSVLGDATATPPTGQAAYEYPEHYSRIETRVEIEKPSDRVAVVTLEVRFQEKGDEQYGFQAKDGSIKPIGRYQTLIVDRWFR